MFIPPPLLQFAGSLIAILALAWLVSRLGLGSPSVLKSDSEALEAANHADDGFAPKTLARDAGGHGAILRDSAGQMMVLKPHGSHFASRILGASASAETMDTGIRIDSGEKRFGMVELSIADPEPWVEAINELD